MELKFKVPRGTRDFLPEEMSKRNYVEKAIRKVFESYGFQQIQTPIFEEFLLFAARSGEEIRNSMFTFFSDDKEFALRPELTAAVCRLIASGKMSIPKPYEIYYIGPCFRYERPQAGRYREFFQAGIELMGTSSSQADAKVLAVVVSVLKELGLKPFELKIGNIGIFRSLLEEQKLDFDKQNRIINNIDNIVSLRDKLEIIFSKKQLTQEDKNFVISKIDDIYKIQEDLKYSGKYEIKPSKKTDNASLNKWMKELPKILEETYKAVWCKERGFDKSFAELLINVSKTSGKRDSIEKTAKEVIPKNSKAYAALEELLKVLDLLETYGVKDYTVLLGVARGLDFYTGTVFEVNCPLLGAQKQICGGGRYDKLVEEFGGPSTPATGFAFGFDRVVEALEASKGVQMQPKAEVFIGAMNADLNKKAIEIAQRLRSEGIIVAEDIDNLSLNKKLEYCNKIGVRYFVLVGQRELKEASVSVKDLKTGEQKIVKIESLAKVLSK